MLAGSGFRSVVRTRVLERIAQACVYPVALIVAPAGYGKSVALRQYLDTLSEPLVRFDVRPEHATLPAFIRAFAESLSGVAPHMVTSLPDALRGTPTAEELAAWFNAQLQDYHGLIVVDDLQFAQAAEVPQFLRSAIHVTKDRIHWLIATRSVPDLPIASWITYGDMDFAVDEHDLAFTIEEAREASFQNGSRDDELRRFVEMTGGWATALNFALRMRVRTSELTAIGATTREMVYRYLAEQVYDHLSASDRELLHFAAFLPVIDVDLLIEAGYPNALEVLERLRKSAAFLSVEDERRYRCHDLFRDFLQHRVDLFGKVVAQEVQLNVAKALVSAGRIAEALRLYVAVQAKNLIAETLESYGLLLADTGHGDVLDAALQCLEPERLTENARALCLRAVREADNGRSDRAARLFQKAMQQAPDRALQAEAATRYAIDLYGLNEDPAPLLEPFRNVTLPDSTRAVIFSLLALSYATNGRKDAAYETIAITEKLAENVKSEALRPRLLYRVGAARFFLNEPPSIVNPILLAALQLADENGLYVTSCACLHVLARTALFWDENRTKYDEYTRGALVAAEKSGHRASIRRALVCAIDAQFMVGDRDGTIALMQRIDELPAVTDAGQRGAIAMISALLSAWDGDFPRACRLSDVEFPQYNFDRVACGAKRALYAVGARERDKAVAIIKDILDLIDSEDFQYPFALHMAEMARLLCGAAEALAGRVTAARRILNARPLRDDSTVQALRAAVQVITDRAERGHGRKYVVESLEALTDQRYGSLSLLLRNLIVQLIPDDDQPNLTDAELRVLRALDQGRSPKEIAQETGRSVHTVRTLIQRATEKLGCSGRQQAIAEARRWGLLEGPASAGRSSVPA